MTKALANSVALSAHEKLKKVDSSVTKLRLSSLSPGTGLTSSMPSPFHSAPIKLERRSRLTQVCW